MQQANIGKDVVLLIDGFKANKITDANLEVAEVKKLIIAGHYKH